MTEYQVQFNQAPKPVKVPGGSLLSDAASQAEIPLNQPCGGQGRCGRCAVKVLEGNVRRRSTLRLKPEDVDKGFALACQTTIQGNIVVDVPPQEKIERRLATDRILVDIEPPPGYDPLVFQSLRIVNIKMRPPSLDDQTDDLSRFRKKLSTELGHDNIFISLNLLRNLGAKLRDGNWDVSVVIDELSGEHISIPTRSDKYFKVVDVSGREELDKQILGIAIDIGTTTVSLWLVDLLTGKVIAQTAEYNGQIARGEDVISRIIFSEKPGGSEELRSLVLETINKLIDTACRRTKAISEEIVKAVVVGNSTMIHLMLGIPASFIRKMPFISSVNQPPKYSAQVIGLHINPEVLVDCLPSVASYVGADISAGVYASGLDDSEDVLLFLDVGTNGEIVLGSKDWLITCACSAGPAFEGSGVRHGMRATKGAIEEVWINSNTYNPTYRVIGKGKPKGICGSGLISLVAEMFMTGIIDKAGNINYQLKTDRIRKGEHGWEYVVAWSDETSTEQAITITHVDINNLLRAKAAIYAGFSVLAQNVGFPLEDIKAVLVAGSFGRYINVEKAVQIGLLPDQEWDRFKFLGNTAVKGAYLALIDQNARKRITNIASKMTYIELSADNKFYEEFMSASFFPHTDGETFPSVIRVKNQSLNNEI